MVGPGQYLKIDTTAVYTSGVALGDPGAGGRSVEWLDKSFDHLYVPADHAGEWIWNREARFPTTFFSEEAKAEAIKYQQSQAGEPSSTGELLRAPGGNFYGEQRHKAAALIPGVTVVDRQANLDGKVGTGIGIESPNRETRMDIIIDPATGLLIGEREITLTPGKTFTAGTATAWTSVQTSVVNSAS